MKIEKIDCGERTKEEIKKMVNNLKTGEMISISFDKFTKSETEKGLKGDE